MGCIPLCRALLSPFVVSIRYNSSEHPWYVIVIMTSGSRLAAIFEAQNPSRQKHAAQLKYPCGVAIPYLSMYVWILTRFQQLSLEFNCVVCEYLPSPSVLDSWNVEKMTSPSKPSCRIKNNFIKSSDTKTVTSIWLKP